MVGLTIRANKGHICSALFGGTGNNKDGENCRWCQGNMKRGTKNLLWHFPTHIMHHPFVEDGFVRAAICRCYLLAPLGVGWGRYQASLGQLHLRKSGACVPSRMGWVCEFIIGNGFLLNVKYADLKARKTVSSSAGSPGLIEAVLMMVFLVLACWRTWTI